MKSEITYFLEDWRNRPRLRRWLGYHMEWSPLHFPKSGEPNKTGFEEIDCEWILKPTDRKWV